MNIILVIITQHFHKTDEEGGFNEHAAVWMVNGVTRTMVPWRMARVQRKKTSSITLQLVGLHTNRHANSVTSYNTLYEHIDPINYKLYVNPDSVHMSEQNFCEIKGGRSKDAF